MDDISIITTHFYDFDWTELLIKNIQQFTDSGKIKEILIINQDRCKKSADRLVELDHKIRVIEYAKSEAHFEKMGHDHAAVLNLAVKEAEGKWIIIFDSDAHPISNEWLHLCEKYTSSFDAILAQDPTCKILSHPCFMVIKKDLVDIPLLFDDRLFSDEMDTGRLIAEQIKRTGKKVLLVPPTPAFNGYWGYIYLNSIYHHQSGSFLGGDDRLKNQISWKHKFFKYVVVQRRKYNFSFDLILFFSIFTLLEKLKKFLRLVFRPSL